jgi:hypothetical protein
MITEINQQINDFIDNYGDTVTIYTVTMTYNSYGDGTASYSSGTSTNGLMLNTNKDLRPEGEGHITEGVPRILLKSTSTVALKDKITHRSIDYTVSAVRSFSNFENETNQPKIVELTRV